MSMVASEAAGPHRIPALDNGLKNAFKVWSDVKRHPQQNGEPMIEPPSPGNIQAKVDDDFVRRKLRDSLASALEMVVGKQLVKSVLGLATDIEGGGKEAKSFLQASLVKQEEIFVDGTIYGDAGVRQSDEEVKGLTQVLERNQPVNTHIDGGLAPETDVAKDETETPCTVSTTEQSGQHVSNSQVNESSLKGFEREEIVPMVDEGKGGLQLMEQARKVACSIESNLFSLNGGVNKKYKEKARSLLFNLKDKSNPELRVRVFKGEIHPDILVRMSAVQLASNELCQWRIAKAEEFASMVVLTDADMDPRRIVKKTHKGEFQVVLEDIMFPAGVESVALQPAVPVQGKVGAEGKGGNPSSGRIGGDGSQSNLADETSVEGRQLDGERILQSPLVHETIENESMETEDELGNDPPSIRSRDEYIISSGEPSRRNVGEPSYSENSVPDGAVEILDAENLESNGDQMWTNSVSKLRNSETLKLSKSPSISLADPGSVNGASSPKNRKIDDGSLVWEGSLQLSATRSASVDVFYKSGERLELKDWPQSVEVKGRVRLAVLDKFLQDLQLSSSRTITVFSVCPAGGQVGGEQMGVYLKEIADQYRKGERAGFAEPKPGFELYLLATDSACLDLLREEHRTIKGILKREDEALVGVVVWRKNQSQRPFSGGPEMKGRVKKGASSNLVLDSPTRVNTKPLRGTEAPNVGGVLPSSLKSTSATSLVNISGNSSFLSAQCHGSSSVTTGPAIHTDYQQSSPASTALPIPPAVGSMNRVIEHAQGTSLDSSRPSQKFFDGEDLPPGFLPGPMPAFPQTRSTTLNAEAKQQGSPFVGRDSGSIGLAGNRGLTKNTPPGFWPESAGKLPSAVMQRIGTPSQQDDDDLPEFKFEAEEMAQQTTSNYLTPVSETQVLASHSHKVVPQSATGLQHIGGPTAIHNVPLAMEFPPILNGLPSRHVSQQEEPLAPQLLSPVPFSQGWDCGGRAREIVHSTTQQDMSRFVPPMNAIIHKNLNLSRVPKKELVGEEELSNLGHHVHARRVLGTSPPFGFTSPGVASSYEVGRTGLSNGYPPRNSSGPPALVGQLGWPYLPESRTDHTLHINPQPPHHHMVADRQQLEMMHSAINTPRRAPLLQQEVRRNEWQAIGSSNPSESSQSNSSWMSSRSRVKLEPKVNICDERSNSEFNIKEIRHSTRGREYNRAPSLGSSRDRGSERSGCRSPYPAREKRIAPSTGQGLNNDVGGGSDPISKSSDVQPPKRERKRERDQ